MALYIAVSLALTAAVNYTQLDTPEPVAYALRLLGWPDLANLIAIGVFGRYHYDPDCYLFGQSRIFFAVSRDGLLPQHLCKIHDTYHTPYLITIVGRSSSPSSPASSP